MLRWQLLTLISLLFIAGCGDLEPEMQDTRTVIMNMDFNKKSSSRTSSSISESELNQYNTHLILAVPAGEYLTDNYLSYYYSSFDAGLMNPQDRRVNLEIPLNTQIKVFAFLFQGNYSMGELIQSREVGYYGQSGSFYINNQTNNLSLGINLQSTGNTSGGGNTGTIEEVEAIGTSSYSKPNYTFASTIAGTISYGGTCSSATTSAIVGNNYITFNTLSNGTHSNCTIKVTDSAGNESNTLTITSFTISSIFLSVGTDGKILRSLDGLSWNNITSGTSLFLWRVSHGKNIFVASGGGGTIITSPDGTNWTIRSTPISTSLRGIIYRYNTFVVVGGSGKVLTSSDGITWTSNNSGISQTLWDITFGKNIFVASGSGGKIISSSDGISFNTQSITSSNLRGIVFNNNTFVTVGTAGEIFTSSDATNWTSRTSNAGGSSLYDITFANNTFVAVGASGKIVTSSDGITWTLRSTPVSGALWGVGFSNDKFTVAGSGGTIITSTDGITWTLRSTPISSALYGSIK